MSMSRNSIEFKRERRARLLMLEKLRAAYPTRLEFQRRIMQDMFGCHETPMQRDMINFIDTQYDHFMVQMPRGQGKTVINAISAVYDLIQDPTARIAIFSGNDEMAQEIAGYIFKIFSNTPELAFMLPDRKLRDKASTTIFSVCGYLKGLDKSPSVRCRPIFGGFQGIRADKVIADDVEMLSNSATAEQRDKLRMYIQELESLLDGSKERQMIMVLGTPQSNDSVYNQLPSLGFNVRIWTARIPTREALEYYGDFLAPYVRDMYDKNPDKRTGYGLDGNRGAPTDPSRYDEDVLNRKEKTQTAGGMFDLQYMLCTSLADKDRYPLNLSKMLFMPMSELTAPTFINTIRSPQRLIKLPMGFSVPKAKLYDVMSVGELTDTYESIVMYIDPSGGGIVSQDELAYAVVKSLNGNVFVDKVHGLKGGFEDSNLEHLAGIIGHYWSLNIPFVCYVEDNYGNGMFRDLLQSVLKSKNIRVELIGDKVSGQKETRIIGTMLPMLESNRLVFNSELIESDISSLEQHPIRSRTSYSLFHQMKHLTPERKSLRHDDRLDALAGALKFFADLLIVDQQDKEDAIRKDRMIDKLRKHSPRSADVLLKNLGLISEGNCKGLSHTELGRSKLKGRDNGSQGNKDLTSEKRYKTPFEKERDERVQAKINDNKVIGADGRVKSSGYAGTSRSFYKRRGK